MSRSNKKPPAPKVEAYFDEFDERGDAAYAKFEKTDDLSQLKIASELFGLSCNPEGKGKSQLTMGMYLLLSSRKEKDLNKSISLLEKALDQFSKATSRDSEETLRIKLEYLKKKRETLKDSSKELVEVFRELAETYKKLGKEKDYHAEMALHYLFSLREIDTFNPRHEEVIALVVSHAKDSGMNELMYKAKSIFHQHKAKMSGSFKISNKELKDALEATQMTEDKFGSKEIEARLKFSEAMLTASKTKRKVLLNEVADMWKEIGNIQEEYFARNLAEETPIKIQALKKMIEDLLAKQGELNKVIHEQREIKPGAYKLFHHHAHLLERIKDLDVIIDRLGRNRKQLTELAIRENNLRPKKIIPGRPFSKRLQKVLVQSDKAKQEMKHDLESLYIYGKLALDQWSYVIGHLSGTAIEDFNFHILETQMRKKKQIDPLKTLAKKHYSECIWLFYQVKGFRNNFIEHVADPWQRGSTMSLYGDDFNLFIPSPVGWLDDDEKDELLKSIVKFAPENLKNAPDDYWEKKSLRRTLEIVFNRIEYIKKYEDREKVWDVWLKIGGSTPSYEVVAFRLLRFMLESTETMIEQIKLHPEKIDIGLPKKEETPAD